MIRLHLVGFTTDLKNLIFADRRDARSGGFVVSLDARLRRTLEEIERLEQDPEEVLESRPGREPDGESRSRSAASADRREPAEEPEAEDFEDEDREEAEPPEPAQPPRPRVASKLTPKQIQSLLRQGKSEEEVALEAGTDVEWVQRFSFAILAERAGVIDAVRSAQLTKPRLGLSAKTIGDAVRASVEAKSLQMSREDIDAAWKAVRTNGSWVVSFEYFSRGQRRVAEYSFDPTSRTVEPLNDLAMDIGWRSGQQAKPAGPKVSTASPRVVSGVSARTARTANAARAAGAAKNKKRPAKPGSSRVPPPRQSAPEGPRPQAGSIRPPSSEPDYELRNDPLRRAPGEPASGLGSRMDVGGGEEDDEFIIRKPKSGPSEYSSLPKVWRPRRGV
ncbi:MAG: septation protein SepH [Actinomycetota bacterium]